MKRLGLLALVLTVVLCATAARADFYVVAGGGPPVGTKITSVPYTISNPGFYFLGGNLTTTGNGITVSVDDVTIDLMGFGLVRGTTGGTGISMAGRNNVEVRNGTLRNFATGIYESSADARGHRITNIRTKYCNSGIWLYGENHQIDGCNTSNGITGIYIYNGSISNCVASYNGNTGIYLEYAGNLLGNMANNNVTYGFHIGGGPRVVDRNSADANGINYFGGGGSTVYGLNATN
ncbi:MAG: right-handed parallel beta-helix repeat-containing protein [Desulfobaccales bacterium]